MGRYLIRRLLIAVPVLWGISVFTFVFINAAPGDPISAMVINPAGGVSYTPADLQVLRERYGLDRPAPVRYVAWLGQVLRGNLGRRIGDSRPVAQVIRERMGATLELMCVALAMAVLVGVPLGVLSALKQYSRLDYLLTVTAFAGISLPEFFVAVLLIFVFALKLHLLPTSGMISVGAHFSLEDNLRHLILPATALAASRMSSIVRYARSSTLDVFRQDYVVTARAKGLLERTVIRRHAFRNAVLPLITIIGLQLPGLLGGAAIVEAVFQWPGMGTLYLDSVSQRDYATIMGLVMMSGVLVLASNLLVDVLYAVADPRIRYE
jgi:peptide/nickel transport system permease protein